MKIGILHSGDLKKISPGGVSQYIEKVIENNRGKNEITLFGTCEYEEKFELFKKYKQEVNGHKYTFIPVSYNNKSPLSVFYFFNIFIMYYKNKKLLEEMDILYAQRMEYVLPFKFILRKKKVAMAVHGSGKYAYLFWGNIIGTIYNYVEKLAVKRANKVIVLLNRKEFGVPYYKNKFNKFRDKITYGKVPIDINLFKPTTNKEAVRNKLGIRAEEKVILYCGRVENNPKRVLLFPKIAKKINEEIDNLKWIVVGNGNDLESLKSDIKKEGLEKIFEFKGHVKHGEDLVHTINCADVSILLSSFEGICMSALESIACGVPIIATDVGDVNEYIKNGCNGKVIKNSSDEEIVEAAYDELKKVLLNNEKIELDNVFKEYSSDIVYNELIDILKNS